MIKSKIRLNKIKLFGYHGVNDNEKKIGQNFEINIEIYPQEKDGILDEIDSTIDYLSVYNKVKIVFFKKRYKLIESLAEKIAKELMAEFNLKGCKIAVAKPEVPIDGIIKSVEAEVDCYA